MAQQGPEGLHGHRREPAGDRFVGECDSSYRSLLPVLLEEAASTSSYWPALVGVARVVAGGGQPLERGGLDLAAAPPQVGLVDRHLAAAVERRLRSRCRAAVSTRFSRSAPENPEVALASAGEVDVARRRGGRASRSSRIDSRAGAVGRRHEEHAVEAARAAERGIDRPRHVGRRRGSARPRCSATKPSISERNWLTSLDDVRLARVLPLAGERLELVEEQHRRRRRARLLEQRVQLALATRRCTCRARPRSRR